MNVLGGLIEHSQSNTVSGIPGLSPACRFCSYFAADNNKQSADEEVLIVVIPHIIRTPNITAENLRAMASGTDTNPEIRLESEVLSPPAVTSTAQAAAPPAALTPALQIQPPSPLLEARTRQVATPQLNFYPGQRIP